jgi:hypothetical protein
VLSGLRVARRRQIRSWRNAKHFLGRILDLSGIAGADLPLILRFSMNFQVSSGYDPPHLRLSLNQWVAALWSQVWKLHERQVTELIFQQGLTAMAGRPSTSRQFKNPPHFLISRCFFHKNVLA